MNLEGSVAFDVEEKDVSLDLVVTPDVDLWHGQADEEVARVQLCLDVVRHEGGETFDCHLYTKHIQILFESQLFSSFILYEFGSVPKLFP